jgi:hypothetical protein
MKITASFILITIIIAGCFAKKALTASQCSKFREGRYAFTKTRFHHWGNYNESTERIDSIETIITSGRRADTTIFKISWTGDCSYERTFIKSTNRFIDSLFPLIREGPNQYIITASTDKYYIEQSMKDRRERDTVWFQ